MNSVVSRREEMEKTIEERAIACLYAYCSQQSSKEKKKLKKKRAPNRNPRYVGH